MHNIVSYRDVWTRWTCLRAEYEITTSRYQVIHLSVRTWEQAFSVVKACQNISDGGNWKDFFRSALGEGVKTFIQYQCPVAEDNSAATVCKCAGGGRELVRLEADESVEKVFFCWFRLMVVNPVKHIASSGFLTLHGTTAHASRWHADPENKTNKELRVKKREGHRCQKVWE